ncbi:MAG: creatininase family protein [Candidatus Nitrosocaldus sp.]|nr:creatininase family protein [Candidatus Nitrosocaldus sp.]MCS7142017.1 creatininase family protein [Candidatus Nitrosocaldus sp.]MDW7999394.1 creatininase family protein [Candidatus Nitrosocaldus sp.]MDW8274981.1 creatininase family protein [Candidatus Nitrosocaldus sp.]
MNLAYARDDDARDAIRRDGKVRAILPIGSLEQHGKHLPLATDSIIAEHIAAMVAERINALLLPCIGYGISYEHEPLFHVSISASTLCMLVDDVCKSLANMGVNRLIVLNAHYGNEHALLSCTKELAERYRSRMLVYSITYSLFLDRADHAGENETSLMLAIRPDLVRMDLVSRGEMKQKQKQKEEGKKDDVTDGKDMMGRLDAVSLSRITLLPGSMASVARDGVVGDPRMASRDRGNALLEEICSRILKVIEEVERVYEQMSARGR